MQSLQAMSKAPTQPANLPPLQNLPSWSRNALGRRKQPRPIIRDRLQPIKSIREEMDEGAKEKSNDKSNFSGRIVSAPSRGHILDQPQRMDNIEKRLDYLRTQHAETLTNLHSEIERLKAENKGEYIRKQHSVVQVRFALDWIDEKSRLLLEKGIHVEKNFSCGKCDKLGVFFGKSFNYT